MRASDRLLKLLSHVRPRGDNKWSARCPAHPDRQPSLSVKQTADRVLVKCWTGCPTPDVMAALGLSLADLFDSPRTTRPDDAAATRYHRALRGLRQWRSDETLRCAVALRERDAFARAINESVRLGLMTESEALRWLVIQYDGYDELEHKFEVLRCGNDAEALEVRRG